MDSTTRPDNTRLDMENGSLGILEFAELFGTTPDGITNDC